MKKIFVVTFSLLILCITINGQIENIWSRFSLGNPLNNEANYYQKVFFLDGLRGWVISYNGAVLKTDDAGDSWKLISKFTEKNLNSIYFVRPNIGYLVGNYKIENPSKIKGNSCLVMKTEDGGKTWIDSSPIKNYRTCSIHNVFFTNDFEGWIVGEAQTFSDNQSFGIVFFTKDGGKSWLIPKLPKNTNTFFNSIKFTSNGKGWLIGDEQILSTNNKGINWVISYGNKEVNYFGVDVFEDKIWVVGNRGSILFSKNNGKSWSKVKLQKDLEKFWFSDIKFVNEKRGWIVGGFSDQTVILSTENGGESWLLERTPNTNGFLKSVAVSQKKMIAVGEENIILFRSKEK